MDNLKQIQDQIAALQDQAQKLITAKRADAIAEVKALMKSYGITTKDLGLKAEHTKGSVAIKYRHGDFTWTGRGRKPKFVEDYPATGGNLEDLLIK